MLRNFIIDKRLALDDLLTCTRNPTSSRTVIQVIYSKEGRCRSCEHVKQANLDVRPSDDGCAECLQTGERWVQLRKCLICGHVGCCDSSPGQHANKHFKETGHPVMQAFQSGELEVVLRARDVCVR